jgi:hypothetical protein
MHSSGGRAHTDRVKAAWVVAGWLVRRLYSGGVIGAARWQGDASNWRSPTRPREKSLEQGRPYNQGREIGRRREGGGGARISWEFPETGWSKGALLFGDSSVTR